MYYDYSYAMEEAMSSVVLSLLTSIPSSLISIATYVLTALALYTIAKRRGIGKPWLAWVPVANCWIIGSISDQYRYVAKGENKSKRKVLLWLNIASWVLLAVFFVVFIVMIVGVVQDAIYGMDEEEMLVSLLGSLGGMMGLMLPIMGVSIAYAIVCYMALYDIYASCDPNNKTLYLVLSILVGLAQPICLFICRNKDFGMPPRRDLPSGGQPQQSCGQAQYQQPYGQYQQGGQYQQPYGQYQQGGQYQQPYSQGQYQQPYSQGQYQQGSQYQQPYSQYQQPPRTEEYPQPPQASPYAGYPDPSAPQHPQEDAPEQL